MQGGPIASYYMNSVPTIVRTLAAGKVAGSFEVLGNLFKDLTVKNPALARVFYKEIKQGSPSPPAGNDLPIIAGYSNKVCKPGRCF